MARTRGSAGERSLHAAMVEPNPDVVVLDFVEDDLKFKEVADPKKDLWLSTADGRYQSAIIPVRVGPQCEVFPIHRDILISRSEYFSKALEGEFKEASEQAIDLPEEDPVIFSFLVAYLYEGKYIPIKAVATVLVPDFDKGKGRELNDDTNSGSDDGSDSAASASDDSTRSRRRRENRRRRQERAWEQRQRKEPGRHRPDCNCASCTTEVMGPPCWNCGVTRRPPIPRNRWYNGGPVPPHQPVMIGGRPPRRERARERRRGSRNNAVVVEDPVVEERMSVEDLRTWSLAYSLSIDVYICAERYLMQDFKECIAAYIINNFEIAGLEAALPAVLESCKKLSLGVSPVDPLLKKVFARVGFLQARLWKNYPEETSTFFSVNPEIAVVLMREMIERKEEDVKDDLPAMDRTIPWPLTPREDIIIQGPRRYDGPIYR